MAGEAEGEHLNTLVAPAKLTTSLRVTGRRPDGYHLLDAEMVSLDLADEVTFLAPSPGDRGAIDLEVAPEVKPGQFEVPTGDTNLIARALKAVDRRARVHLLKRIPPGAGLGGGSADAAAVLRWAGCSDLELAASLGADVPFCLHGGRARVRGIGEDLVPLPHEHRTYTLLIPPFGCSTPRVYATWDEMGGPTGDGPNDLEPAALAVEPRLAEWRDELAQATGQIPVLAGSGSTWFVEGAHPGEDRIVTHTLPAY